MLALILFLSLGATQAATETASTQAAEAATDEGQSAREEPSRDRLICRSRPVLGSRIARQRDCRTEEEWRVYWNDMEQSRRDINDRGMRGQPE